MSEMRSITREFFGDPAPGRSALAGFKPLGEDYLDPSHMDSGHSLRPSQSDGKWKKKKGRPPKGWSR